MLIYILRAPGGLNDDDDQRIVSVVSPCLNYKQWGILMTRSPHFSPHPVNRVI